MRTDLAKVNQILFLLLDNAVKFTPRGPDRDPRPACEGDQLVCEIADTGIGICPDDQQFIFDEFFQVDDAGLDRSTAARASASTLVRDLLIAARRRDRARRARSARARASPSGSRSR